MQDRFLNPYLTGFCWEFVGKLTGTGRTVPWIQMYGDEGTESSCYLCRQQTSWAAWLWKQSNVPVQNGIWYIHFGHKRHWLPAHMPGQTLVKHGHWEPGHLILAHFDSQSIPFETELNTIKMVWARQQHLHCINGVSCKGMEPTEAFSAWVSFI